jgi:thioester reductase-like protein
MVNIVLKSWIDRGEIPDLEAALDMTPVDYVSRAVVHLSQVADSLGKVFHLINEPVLLKDVADWIRALGFPLKNVPYGRWRATMAAALAAPDARSGLASLAPFFAVGPTRQDSPPAATDQEDTLDWFGNLMTVGYARGRVRFDTRVTETTLGSLGISCPRIDRAIFERCVSYFVTSGFVEREHSVRSA